MISKFMDVRPDTKRRVALPADFLDSLPATARLVAHVEAPGRYIIETPEAAVAAAAARIHAALDPSAGDYDAVADVHEMRDEDARISDVNFEARSRSLHGEDTGAGDRLLAALGLSEA